MDESRPRVDQRVRRTVRERLRDAVISGVAVVIPLVITFVVFMVALNAISEYLDVLSDYLVQLPWAASVPTARHVDRELAIELLTPAVLVAIVLLVGFVVEGSKYGERAVDYFDAVLGAVPGVGAVYESFRQMSDVVLESDVQNFREVKLVEFPADGAYTLGFVTTETPPSLTDAIDHDEMLTMFLPLAPNPVMGGHLVHLPTSKVHDVEMTVEEGVRAIVTSGVAIGPASETDVGLSESQLRSLSAIEASAEPESSNSSQSSNSSNSSQSSNDNVEGDGDAGGNSGGKATSDGDAAENDGKTVVTSEDSE
ncbi:hypothetical protein AUR64_18720 [Haloprofundus marisrubri]|uniref:DUF502 domain-containing protein n=1 Tax=Haloprofundus marisrubri TaxID=1514971 RepID=A0A0W1R5Z5_9EURY|nr:DUF502 domain-containing protein [Haloprofundus marisrubri]KTG08698.1 hypothetical protein AUR64_18720 [Haloprofundus marisrubri]